MNKVITWCLTRFKADQRRNATSDILRGCLLLLSMTPFQFSYGSELPPFPNAGLRLSADEDRQNHPVITSRMKRVNGVVTSDGSQWFDGHLNRALYLLPPGHSSSQGYDFYVDQLRDQGVETLFQCRSFSCGASNFWANDIFEISTLYGQDKEQAFFIGKKQGSYYSVYSVRRGNGRVYTLVDVFKPSDYKVEKVSEQRESRGNVKLRLNDGLVKSSDLKLFVEEMNGDSAMNALFIIHSPVPETLAELDVWQQKMEVQKTAIQQYLKHQGIAGSRLRFNISVGTDDDSMEQKTTQAFWLEIVPLN
ncbi:DUF4892 domain-containing protein [Endozoicomonas sp.]|uniref:DUF4892 domain-containing protein n=1 Tax=Endozoicomonas sp. TaxID=1892382 RepID=UPI0028878CBA|nr:DUF4892 domain-containing protein [Endozoicomonas sp.]